MCRGYSSPWHKELFPNYQIFSDVRWKSPSSERGPTLTASHTTHKPPCILWTEVNTDKEGVHVNNYITYYLKCCISGERKNSPQTRALPLPLWLKSPGPPHWVTVLFRASRKLQLHTYTERFCSKGGLSSSLDGWYWCRKTKGWRRRAAATARLCVMDVSHPSLLHALHRSF